MLPFEPLNLRWNPFGEVPAKMRGALAVVDDRELDVLAARLARPGFALELVGAPGRGKSTHLYALHRRFPELPVTRVRHGERAVVPETSVVFVDDAQHLPSAERRRLFRREASFVIASQQSHAEELTAAGVDLVTRRVAGIDRRRLEAVVAKRISWSRLRPGPLPEVPSDVVAELVDRHGDDLRSILDELYDGFQRRGARAS